MLMLLRLITGPSTNLYVGPQEKHYTIPKRLLYHFSGYAKVCLEGGFLEASANAIHLRDVDPNVFQYLWQWLYTGELRLDSFYASDAYQRNNQGLVQACQLLCRIHTLGERLLFDERFLYFGVQMELDKVIEKAKTWELSIPFNPDTVEEVLSKSAPAQYEVDHWWFSLSLRPILLQYLCNFQFCTTVEFKDYKNCFRKDGAFAAELLTYLASEIKWAKERGEAQVGRPIDGFEDDQLVTEGQGAPRPAVTGTQQNEGIWVALRHICTSEGCSATDIRAFSKHFELDSAFAADFLNSTAKEWLEIVESWGKERGYEVDVAAEHEEEERIAQEASATDRLVRRIMLRGGWS